MDIKVLNVLLSWYSRGATSQKSQLMWPTGFRSANGANEPRMWCRLPAVTWGILHSTGVVLLQQHSPPGLQIFCMAVFRSPWRVKFTGGWRNIRHGYRSLSRVL